MIFTLSDTGTNASANSKSTTNTIFTYRSFN